MRQWDDWRELVLCAREGDREAFAGLVERFHGVATNYARAILRDRESARDAVQEAFVQAWLGLSTLREPSAFPGWLRAIVSHCSHRHLRSARETVPIEHAAHILADAPTPAEIAERREMAEAVARAVDALPGHERDVTRLFYFHDCSQREIADLLGLPVSTVNNRLYSSRRRLRSSFADMEPVVRTKGRPTVKRQEKRMQLNYEATRRTLPRGETWVTVRRMTREDIPAMRRLDDEIAAGMDFANAQRPPGGESGVGGPWSEDEWMAEHFGRYEKSGNMTLLVEDDSGKLIGFADLWSTSEPEPFGRSLDLGCTDYLWEYYHLGMEMLLLQEAESVARLAGLPAVDIGTNTSSGDYPSYRRFGMKVFYEYDNLWCECKPAPRGWKPVYLPVHHEEFDHTGLVRVSHWAPTDFDFAHEPGRPPAQEFEVEGRRIVADFWRLWEPGQEVPINCELFTPPQAISDPVLMAKILRETALLAGDAGAEVMPLPCPCDLAVDESLLGVQNREFKYAWLRKVL